MPAPVLLAPLLIKGFCALCAIGGTCYCVKKVADSYGKHSKREKERLALKGKTVEQAQEDNKVAQKENDEWKKKYDDLDERIKKRDEEIKKFQNKLKDPNLTPEEKNKINSQLAILIDQQENDVKERSSILDKIKKLGERIKNNNSVISGTVSNLDDRHWVWDLITLENILIVAGIYVAYKVLKDDGKK